MAKKTIWKGAGAEINIHLKYVYTDKLVADVIPHKTSMRNLEKAVVIRR